MRGALLVEYDMNGVLSLPSRETKMLGSVLGSSGKICTLWGRGTYWCARLIGEASALVEREPCAKGRGKGGPRATSHVADQRPLCPVMRDVLLCIDGITPYNVHLVARRYENLMELCDASRDDLVKIGLDEADAASVFGCLAS